MSPSLWSAGVRISGATILNNAVALGYPFRESIASALPIVDEYLVNVGQGNDGTWEAVASMASPKIKAFRSDWNLEPTGGSVLSEQTNLALKRCNGDWILYLQADEILHEHDWPRLKRSMEEHATGGVEGLVFDYLHFIASPHVVTDDWSVFYPTAVRAIRNGRRVVSIGDAAGFGVAPEGGAARGLIKARSHARIFHYGWSDFPTPKFERARALSRLYRGEPNFKPEDTIPSDLTLRKELRFFKGTHPAVVSAAIAARPRPSLGRRYALPALVRAWVWFLARPQARFAQARPLLPLWLTNRYWKFKQRRGRKPPSR